MAFKAFQKYTETYINKLAKVLVDEEISRITVQLRNYHLERNNNHHFHSLQKTEVSRKIDILYFYSIEEGI
jgi:hypothetical protein